jgi:hypothetical protein
MWATLAIASALSLAPAQAGKFEITHERVTYGILGPERKDTKVLPGDAYVVSFDIEGLQLKDDGRVRYSVGFKLINDKTKTAVFTKDPQESEVTNALGGSRLPAYAIANIGLETQPGDYTMEVTVTDLLAKGNAVAIISRKFEVLQPKFGLVQVCLFNVYYQNVLPAPAIGVVGQTYLVNGALVGFQLNKDMLPDLTFELRILDEKGQPTLPKPFTGEVNKAARKEDLKLMPLFFNLPLTRPGKFTLEIEATDKIANKTVKQTLSLTVIEPKEPK